MLSLHRGCPSNCLNWARDWRDWWRQWRQLLAHAQWFSSRRDCLLVLRWVRFYSKISRISWYLCLLLVDHLLLFHQTPCIKQRSLFKHCFSPMTMNCSPACWLQFWQWHSPMLAGRLASRSAEWILSVEMHPSIWTRSNKTKNKKLQTCSFVGFSSVHPHN